MLFQNGFQSVLFLVTHLDALLLFGTISMGWLRRITVYELTGLICLYYTIYLLLFYISAISHIQLF